MIHLFILKNALRCILRSKGRNILIGIIVLVIATSCCIGLSIRQASESAKKEALDNLSVTATISFDRQSMMNEMRGDKGEGGTPGDKGERPSFDRDQFSQMMGGSSNLTLEDYEKYAAAESVKDFYYSLTVSLNGTDEFQPVSTSTSEDTPSTEVNDQEGSFPNNMPQGNKGGFMGGMGMSGMSQGDFTLEGYNCDAAMTSFVNGTAVITQGAVFEEGTSDLTCIISEEAAVYNSVATGDEIILSNPVDDDETYIFTVAGIYSDSSANENSFGPMGFSSSDPANKIYLSYNALNSIIESSALNAQTVINEDTGRQYTTALNSSLSATYVFADADGYYHFEEEVRQLGLEDTYSVTSMDITSFENSLEPLKTLSKMAGWFLLVILLIGAVILIVLNIFSVRERKYEIGVLTAMGMKKSKVALQFMTELFAVTLVAVVVGIIIGGVCAVPVTNALLENQISSQQNQTDRIEQNFGRPGSMGDRDDMGMNGGFNEISGNTPPDVPKGFMGDMFNQGAEYISEINSAMNLTVVFQMLLIALGLTLVSGAASMLFIMRYEPLKILANRD